MMMIERERGESFGFSLVKEDLLLMPADLSSMEIGTDVKSASVGRI